MPDLEYSTVVLDLPYLAYLSTDGMHGKDAIFRIIGFRHPKRRGGSSSDDAPPEQRRKGGGATAELL